MFWRKTCVLGLNDALNAVLVHQACVKPNKMTTKQQIKSAKPTHFHAAKFFRPVANDAASKNVWVDKSMVEGIIGNMLFDLDDNNTLTKKECFCVGMQAPGTAHH